jgi:hypothetical protein
LDIDAALIAGAIAGGITGGIIAAIVALGVLRAQRRTPGTTRQTAGASRVWRIPSGPLVDRFTRRSRGAAENRVGEVVDKPDRP